ncbi:MAG: hypothetical protein E7172_00155 [Firmicutes bacterium]|nr:hypothetical protein [Bacillota bacterium]
MDKKNSLLLTVIAVATLLVAVVGATFAFFAAQVSGSASTPIRITTSTSDSLTYGTWTPITLTPNQDNFGVGMEDQIGTTGGTVTLTASNALDEDGQPITSEYCYTATLNITKNELVYTTAVMNDNGTPENEEDDFLDTSNAEPELVINVNKKDHTAGTETEGTDIISNLDITTRTLALQIPTAVGGSDYIHRISATSGNTVADTWNITVTFVNLDTDQNANTGKKFESTLELTTVECSSQEAGE